MKRWCALILTMALLALPCCLPAGAAGLAELKDDFEAYESVAQMAREDGGSMWSVFDAEHYPPANAQASEITLQKTEGMDGVQTQVAHLEADYVQSLGTGQKGSYLQKDGMNNSGKMVVAFRMRLGDVKNFRQFLYREGTKVNGQDKTSFITFFEMFGNGNPEGEFTCMGKKVRDEGGVDPLLLETNKWYEFVLTSTQTVGSRDIPYKFYLNGTLRAEGTYQAADLPNKFENVSVRFGHQPSSAEQTHAVTEFDDIYVGKHAALRFDNMTSTPANGDVAAPADGGTLRVDMGTRIDPSTVTKENLSFTQYFEGETTVLEDYELIPNAYGLTVKLPEGKFVKEARYTLRMENICDFEGQGLPPEKQEITFETVGEPYTPEYTTETLAEYDFEGFTGAWLPDRLNVNPNEGAVASPAELDAAHGTSGAMTLTNQTKTSNGPWMGLFPAPGKYPKEGMVIIECDIRTTTTGNKIQVFIIKDSPGKFNTDLNFTERGKIALTRGETVVRDLMDYQANTWYTIREEINLDTKKADIFINGTQYVKDHPIQTQTLADVPIARVSYNNPGNTGKNTLFLDNFSISVRKERPGIKKMKFLDSAGIDRGGLAPQDTTAIRMYSSLPLNASTVTADSVKLTRSAEGLPVDCSVDYDAQTQVISLSPRQPLVMNMGYKVEITEDVKSLAGVSMGSTRLRSFESGPGDFGRTHLAVLNAAGEEVLSLAELSDGDAVRGQAQVKNGLGTPQQATLIFAWYQGDYLMKAETAPVSLDAYGSDTFTTAPVTLSQVEGSTLRVFIWNGETGKQAVCEPLVLQ